MLRILQFISTFCFCEKKQETEIFSKETHRQVIFFICKFLIAEISKFSWQSRITFIHYREVSREQMQNSIRLLLFHFEDKINLDADVIISALSDVLIYYIHLLNDEPTSRQFFRLFCQNNVPKSSKKEHIHNKLKNKLKRRSYFDTFNPIEE